MQLENAVSHHTTGAVHGPRVSQDGVSQDKNGMRDPNPPYGEKGAFRKLTVTLPQEVYQRLIEESARRKIAGQPNQLLSALLREALCEYLDRLDSELPTGSFATQ
jgi:hypothetical protein